MYNQTDTFPISIMSCKTNFLFKKKLYCACSIVQFRYCNLIYDKNFNFPYRYLEIQMTESIIFNLKKHIIVQ